MSSDIYERYEVDFFKLILNTEKDVTKYGISKKSTELKGLEDAVFKQKPSISNLKRFFSTQVIQGLWAGQWNGSATPFVRCDWLKEALQGLEPAQREQIFKHLEKVESAGVAILAF